MKQFKKGAAALLTTVIVGLLFVVVVAGLTALTSRESRRTSDIELSNRAFFAAEAGVNRASRILDQNPNFRKETCDQQDGLDGTSESLQGVIDESDSTQEAGGTSYQVSLDCVIITDKAKQHLGRLPQDQAAQYKVIGSDSDLASIALEFNDPLAGDPYLSTAGQEGDNNCPNINQVNVLPFETGDGDTNCLPEAWIGPAGFAMNLIYWKKPNGNLESRGMDLSQDVMSTETIIKPNSQRDVGTWGIDTNAGDINTCVDVNEDGTHQSINGTPVDPSISFSCYMKFDLSGVVDLPQDQLKQYNFLLRVEPLYNSTHYRLRFLDNRDQEILTEASQVMIVSTGQSGGVFRKAVALKQGQLLPKNNLFDQAMFSGTDVCKNILVPGPERVNGDQPAYDAHAKDTDKFGTAHLTLHEAIPGFSNATGVVGQNDCL
ncbi:pilus assembly PilX N-terminal domain-containing protein [Candidatus Nomurabacteria bacterium]|nr:pilus assembly PilX N-terminal domain-containing protein [Candidatus Nomurabacteria bacterium]